MKKKDLIHSRTISVNTFEEDDETISIEGSLVDERYNPYIIYATQESHEPGIVHHMKVDMTLSIPSLRILSIVAEMPVVPNGDCLEIKNSVKKAQGMEIKPGFTSDLRNLLGNINGCIHLTNLIQVMASSAVQGIWTYFSRLRGGQRVKMPNTDMGMVINSCWMWREDGPFLRRIRKMLNSRKDMEKKN